MATYLLWHYRQGLARTLAESLEITAGIFRYFSISELFRTLFAPWHRIAEHYGRGFDPGRFFFTLAGNLISRVLGAIVRSLAIMLGLAAGLAAAILGAVWLAFWFLAPLVIVFLFGWGITLLI